MKQISEEDKKRIEQEAHNNAHGDTTIDPIFIHSKIKGFISGAIAENAHLSETIRELEGVLGMEQRKSMAENIQQRLSELTRLKAERERVIELVNDMTLDGDEICNRLSSILKQKDGE